MSTPRAVEKLNELMFSKARVEAEAARLKATMNSAIQLADSVLADTNVAVAGEVVVNEATAGQTTCRLARTTMKSLVLKVGTATLAVTDANDETGEITLAAPLVAKAHVVATYTHIGLKEELLELLATLPRLPVDRIGAFGATRTKYMTAAAWLSSNLTPG